MSPKKLKDLPQTELRREVFKSAVACLTFSLATFAVYFTLPFDSLAWDSQAIVRLIVGLIIFVVILVLLIRRILRSELPQLRAIEALVVSLFLFINFYASVYLEISNHNPDMFNQVLTHSSALYFTIVTFGTVGYGDISPKTDLARLLVSGQIVLDLVFIAALARMVLLAAQITLNREH